MTNPFEVIEARLGNIENLLLDITQKQTEHALPSQPATTNEYWNVDEVALATRLKKSSVYQLTHSRGIPFIKRGKMLLFEKAAIKDWIQ